MGAARPTAEDVIHVKTNDITPDPMDPRKWKKTSDVEIKEAGDRDRRDIILGLKVRKGQSVAGFDINGRSMIGFSDDPTTRDFTTELAESTDPGTEEWKGFKIPRGALPERGSSGKLEKRFSTTLTLEPVILVKPNFQIVPIVVAFDVGELRLGHTWVGFSLITPP